MRKLFLDVDEDISKKKIADYSAQGLPACLIVQKDNNYFKNYVVANRASFLRFFVEGAMQYYKTETIQIPPSLNAQQLVQTLDRDEAVQAYALDHLCISAGERTSLKAICQHFRDTTKIESITLKDKTFAAMLRNATKEMGPEWDEQVKYHIMRTKDGNGVGYLNVTFSHRVVGIQKFTQSTPRHAQLIDSKAVVKDYIEEHLKSCHGETTSMRDILAHFRVVMPKMQEHINDKKFRNRLRDCVTKREDWDDFVEIATVPTEREVYKNLTFVDAKAKFLYAKYTPSPEASSSKRKKPES